MNSYQTVTQHGTVALIDADNTLWDTDAVFRSAQLRLLAGIEGQLGLRYEGEYRLDFVRAYDQALASAHHLHLRYPAQLLVRAIEAGFAGQSADMAAGDAIAGRIPLNERMTEEKVQALVALYVEGLSESPPLLPTVREAIAVAQSAGFRLYVITEGRVERQRKLLTINDLDQAFEGVWELTKTQEQFARLVTRFTGMRVIVVGDQLDRDIVPAKAAGCVAVFVPSRFTPRWNANGARDSADAVARDLLGAMTWCVEMISATR